jgi:hypothetical protein
VLISSSSGPHPHLPVGTILTTEPRAQVPNRVSNPPVYYLLHTNRYEPGVPQHDLIRSWNLGTRTTWYYLVLVCWGCPVIAMQSEPASKPQKKLANDDDESTSSSSRRSSSGHESPRLVLAPARIWTLVW